MRRWRRFVRWQFAHGPMVVRGPKLVEEFQVRDDVLEPTTQEERKRDEIPVALIGASSLPLPEPGR
jgi:hypothetical protein